MYNSKATNKKTTSTDTKAGLELNREAFAW